MSEYYRKKRKKIMDVGPDDGARKRLKVSSQNFQRTTGLSEVHAEKKKQTSVPIKIWGWKVQTKNKEIQFKNVVHI